MQYIEVFEQKAGLEGQREVWVKVLSNTILDWPDVKASLNKKQRDAMLNASTEPTRYFPHLVTKDERAEHGWSFEDWWVFKVTGPAEIGSVL